MTVGCNKEGCEKTWPRDPVLEVECPQCGAGVGKKCERPSGWSGPFVKPHKDRDLLALDEGHYGRCPSGRCPDPAAARRRKDRSKPKRTHVPTDQPTLDAF